MANEQASSTRYVGLDVHKREITYCILDAKGKLIKQQSFLLTRGSLATFCRQALTATDEVALESRQRQPDGSDNQTLWFRETKIRVPGIFIPFLH